MPVVVDFPKEKLLGKIIAKEEKMFIAVRSIEPCACQQRLRAFRAMRRMSFSVLSEQTLQFYLQDLERAEAQKRNLLTEKYARMDGLIPKLSDNEYIPKIVAQEKLWLAAGHRMYPTLIRCDAAFAVYESGELETYSDATLASYYQDVQRAEARGENLVLTRYSHLYKELGYQNLEQVAAMAARKGRKKPWNRTKKTF